MTEYWVSKKQFWCKYCECYIRDDKPSRKNHEEGLRHKGNLERFIRSVAKNSEREDRQSAQEAKEITRINSAAIAAHALDIGTPIIEASTQKEEKKKGVAPVKWQGSGNLSNYSDARSLGLIDEEAEKQILKEEEQKITEGTVGQWQAVRLVRRTNTSTQKPDETQQQLNVDSSDNDDEDVAPPHRIFKERTVKDTNADSAPWDSLEIKLLQKKRKLKPDPDDQDDSCIAGPSQIHGKFSAVKLYVQDSTEVKKQEDSVEESSLHLEGGLTLPATVTQPPLPQDDFMPLESMNAVESKPDTVKLEEKTAPSTLAQSLVTGGGQETTPVFKKRKGARGQARSTALM